MKLKKQTFVKSGSFRIMSSLFFYRSRSKLASLVILFLFSRVDGFSLTGPTQKLKRIKIRTLLR